MSHHTLTTIDPDALSHVSGGAQLTPLARQMVNLHMSKDDQRYFNGAVYSARAARAGGQGDLESAAELQARSDYWFGRAAGKGDPANESITTLRITPYQQR